MKKGISFTFISLAVLLLSGCSLLPAAKPKSSSNTDNGGFNQGVVAGSLWRTSDGGHTFESKSRVSETTVISSADILSIAYHPQKSKTIYVSSVESGLFRTEDGGEKWEPIAFPPKKVYSFIVDRNNPDSSMFASGVLGTWGKIFHTADGGKQWDEVYTEPGQNTVVTTLAQHPNETSVIFAGTSAGTAVKSTDAGKTWKNIGSKIDGVVSDYAFDSNSDPVVYLITNEKKIYYSNNRGEKWIDWEEEKKLEVSELNKKSAAASRARKTKTAESYRQQAQDLAKRNQENKMPPGIVSVAADPLVSGTVYVGTKSGFFRSTDYGKYWHEINIIESAKKFPIRSVALNPRNSKEIVFVAGKAFYKSVDSGTTWAVTGLNVNRDASFVSYDPFDQNYLFIGLRKYQ